MDSGERKKHPEQPERSPMKIIKNFPLFVFLLIGYNIIQFPASEAAPSPLDAVVFKMNLISGAVVSLTLNTLMILTGLVFLYLEILKAMRSSVTTIINHTLSMLVFILFLVEFIVVKNAGTPAFLTLTVMALVAVIAGFTISISTARRDVFVDR
jgi:hypothetical protein